MFTDHTAVDIEPPVADEVLLVVEGAVRAEQTGDGRHGVLGPAHVIHLAVSLLDRENMEIMGLFNSFKDT